MERQVVHLNVAHFMASVEELCDRSLAGMPFIISTPGKARSVALDVSEKAFYEGIRRGMPVDLIAKRIRGIRILPPRPDLYERAERRIFDITSRYSPLVESRNGGHLFLDITGTTSLFGTPLDLAARIREEILERSGLQPIAGLSINKLVSKVATRVVKPDGFIAIQPGDEAGFLSRQTIALLPGIGSALSERMKLLGIAEIGELAVLSDTDTIAAMGKHGLILRDHARGIDASPVSSEPTSLQRMRRERLFATDTNDREEMESALFLLVEELGLRLREHGLSARRIELHVAYTDGERAIGQRTFERSLSYDRDLFAAARLLLAQSLQRRVRVRRIAASLSILQPVQAQMDLFIPPEREKLESLQRAVDRIRNRFGTEAIRVGRTLKAG